LRCGRRLAEHEAGESEPDLVCERSAEDAGLRRTECVVEIRAVAMTVHLDESSVAAKLDQMAATNPAQAVVVLPDVRHVEVADAVPDVGDVQAVDGIAEPDLRKATIRAGHVQSELSRPVAVRGTG